MCSAVGEIATCGMAASLAVSCAVTKTKQLGNAHDHTLPSRILPETCDIVLLWLSAAAQVICGLMACLHSRRRFQIAHMPVCADQRCEQPRALAV